jgi:hypothetical protein
MKSKTLLSIAVCLALPVAEKNVLGMEMKFHRSGGERTAREVELPKRKVLEVLSEGAKELKSPDDFRDYYKSAQRIALYIYDQMALSGAEFENFLAEGPNPFEGQVVANGGIALEFYYGSPSVLWTPLGKLRIKGSGSPGDTKKVLSTLTEKLGLKVLIPIEYPTMGETGPVYQITKDLDGRSLPEVVLKKDKSEMVAYKEAMELWEQVKPSERR